MPKKKTAAQRRRFSAICNKPEGASKRPPGPAWVKQPHAKCKTRNIQVEVAGFYFQVSVHKNKKWGNKRGK